MIKYSTETVISPTVSPSETNDSYFSHTVQVTHQRVTKLRKSELNAGYAGSDGGSSCRTFVSTSKSVLQSLYGKLPVASSTNVMPRLHTSARIS